MGEDGGHMRRRRGEMELDVPGKSGASYEDPQDGPQTGMIQRRLLRAEQQGADDVAHRTAGIAHGDTC